MLCYDRINISEGIDLPKSNNRKECMIFHYWFFNHEFELQDYVFNGCHDLTMLCLNISDITIIAVKNVDYCCIIANITKFEAIDLLKNSVLEDCGYAYKNIVLIFCLFNNFFFNLFV